MRARSWWIDAGRLHGTLAAAQSAAKPTMILPFVPAACVDDATGKYYISSSGALYQLGATATQEAASAPPARATLEEEGLEEAAPGANPYSALELDVADEGNGLADSTDGGTATAEEKQPYELCMIFRGWRSVTRCQATRGWFKRPPPPV